MIKKICFASFVILLIVSCSMFNDLEKPSSASIKSHAAYQIPLGYATGYLREHVDAVKLQEIIDENALRNSTGDGYMGIKVYDYYRDRDNTLQSYIFDYPVLDIPLDFSNYLEQLGDLNLDSGADNSFSQQLEVPDLSDIDFSQDVPLDVQSMIIDNFKLNIDSLPVPEYGDQQITIPMAGFDFPININTPEFTSIKFKQGKLKFEFQAEQSTSMQIRIQADIGRNKNVSTSLIVHSSNRIPAVGMNPGSFEMDLAGKELPPKMYMMFMIDKEGNDPTSFNTVNYSVKVSLSEDTKISKITGFTMPDGVDNEIAIDQTVSLGSMGDYLKSAEIADGNLNYGIKIPTSWTGVSADTELEISGGLNISREKLSANGGPQGYAVKKDVSLVDEQVVPSDIRIQGRTTVNIQNATITFDYDDEGNLVDKILFEGKASIKELKNAQIKMNDMLAAANTNKTISQNIPENVAQYVKAIYFNKIGLTGTIRTDLPANDMVLNAELKSDFFDIPSLKSQIEFDGRPSYKLDLVKQYVNASDEPEPKRFEVNAANPLDFTFDLNISSANEEDSDVVSFNSIKVGHTYNIEFDVGFEYDWEKVVLETSSMPLQGDYDTGFDIHSMLSANMTDEDGIVRIIDNVRICSDAIQGRLTVTKPDLDELDEFDGFSGYLKMKFTIPDVGPYEGYLIGEGAPASINFVNVKHTYDELATSDRVIEKIDKIPASAELSAIPLIKMFNDKPDDVMFEYNFAMGTAGREFTIRRSAIESLKSSSNTTSLKISITLIVSLKFYIEDDIIIDDIFTLFGKGIEDDVLNRSDVSEVPDYKEITDIVKKITLQYKFVNNTGFRMNAEMFFENSDGIPYLQTVDSDGVMVNKKIFLKGDVSDRWSTLVFTRNDVNEIYENYPFIPKVKITIPKVSESDAIKVPRAASFSGQAILEVQTDGKYKFWGD